MSGRNQERHWIAAFLLIVTSFYSLAKPVLWMAGLTVLETGTGEPEWVFVLPMVEGVTCIVIFVAGTLFLAKRPTAVGAAVASCVALLLIHGGIVVARPRRIVGGGWWMTNTNIGLWLLPMAFASACVVAALLAKRSESLLVRE